MTDLDFDELDRAVNSLMSGKKSNDKAMPEEQNQNPILDPTDSKVQEPIVTPAINEDTMPGSADPGTKEPEPSASSADGLKTDSQIQKRSSGLYMDMMPSKPQTQANPLQNHGASALLSQSSGETKAIAPEPPKTLTPFHDITPPKTNSSLSGPSTGLSPDTTSLQALSDKTDDSNPSLSQDLLGSGTEPLASKGITEEIVQEDESTAKVTDKPIETVSPFLADAKVEKRPLGAVAPDEQTQDSTESSATEEDSDKSPTAPLMPSAGLSTLPLGGLQDENNQVSAPVPMPPEFHEDLLAVEADRQEDAAVEKPFDAPATIEQASAVQVGPLSITQQYQEKMSTGDQSHTPIYDTNVQPLNHPPHNKSGWGAVIWIIILIALFVVIAAILYFTGIL